jgi:Flp pilus assembly protein TadG
MMGRGRRKFRRAVARLLRSERGAAYVEFAIIGIPFMLLILGTIELGLILWASADLENATSDAARLIRTGQAQTMDASALTNAICAGTVILPGCASQLKVSVQKFQTLSQVAMLDPKGSDGNLRQDLSGDPTQVGPLQNVLVTVYYPWTLLNPLTVAALSNLANGDFLLQASAVFKTEPFISQPQG